MNETTKKTYEKEVLTKTIIIDAPKEKVWDVLLTDETYRKWTAPFHPGSYAESEGGGLNWKEGSRVYFKGPEGDGMISDIVVHKPAEKISFSHIGILQKGVEDFDSDEVKVWTNARETYTAKDLNGKTEFHVEMDIDKEHFEFFSKAWDEALAVLKELSEK